MVSTLGYSTRVSVLNSSEVERSGCHKKEATPSSTVAAVLAFLLPIFLLGINRVVFSTCREKVLTAPGGLPQVVPHPVLTGVLAPLN
jgi:hypothetical protein